MNDINMSEKSEKKKYKIKISMKYWIILLCLASAICTVTAVGFTVMPVIAEVLKEQVQTHMDDFVVSGTEIVETVIEELEERIFTIENMAKKVLLGSGNGVPLNNLAPDDRTGTENLSKEETKNREELESSDGYTILSEQLVRYADSEKTTDVILLTDETGQILASNVVGYVGESLGTELAQTIFDGTGEIKTQTQIYEEKGKVTLVFSKEIYEGNELQGAILYYTDSNFLYETITELSLTGIAAPLVYIIDRNTAVVAHTIKDSIGSETGNEVMAPIIEEIQSGISYADKAHYLSIPYGSLDKVSITYSQIEGVDWIFMVAALDSQIYSGVSHINKVFIQYALVVGVIILILVYFVSNSFSKPIEYMSRIIKKVGELDFTFDVNEKRFKSVTLRPDEVGEMGRSVAVMVDAVRDKLSGMNECSDKVNRAAIELEKITNEISEKAGDTSAITEQLSAGMQETNASTEMITGDVQNLKENVMDMKKQIDQNTALTVEIMERAKSLKAQTVEAKEMTRNTFEQIKAKGSIAMEQSKAVNKINELTNAIMGIADQTSLLALNASIEAARAGESGKGFAVVAGEIGSLAQQSADTVSQITEIVQSVNQAVKNITDCLNTSQEFVEQNVYTDYEKLLRVLDLYNNDADNIHKAMDEIDGNTTRLADTTTNINTSLQAINQTIQEATVGVSDIAGRNSGIGELTAKTYEMVNHTAKIAAELEETAQSFKL